MKSTKSIGIVGFGYVGKAMYKLFQYHYGVYAHDTSDLAFRNGEVNCSIEEINNECQLGVVCVPTPMKEDYSCDLTHVEAAIAALKTPLILLKSTIEIGTTGRLKKATGKRIVFSPEYCGESTYWSPHKFHGDIKETPFFIFGGDKKDTSEMIDWFMPIVGPCKAYHQTDATTAEMVKYMENCFFATKICFCYEIAEICKSCGVDYNEARELWLLDPRINPMHTSVFPENTVPFSGKCLPKDLNALVSLAKKKGYRAELLEEVLKSNQRIAKIMKGI